MSKKRSKGTYTQYVKRHDAAVKKGTATGKAMPKGAWTAYHHTDHHHEKHTTHKGNMKQQSHHHTRQSMDAQGQAQEHGGAVGKAYTELASAHSDAATDFHIAHHHGSFDVIRHKATPDSKSLRRGRLQDVASSHYRAISGIGDRNKGMSMLQGMTSRDQAAHNDQYSRNLHAGNRHPLHPAHPNPEVHDMMEQKHLHEEDADETKGFRKKMDAAKGMIRGPAWLRQEFLKHAKPETKERMKGMSAEEFMVMFNSIKDDEEEGILTASHRALRSNAITLAHENPALRKHLLPLLKTSSDEEANPNDWRSHQPSHYDRHPSPESQRLRAERERKEKEKAHAPRHNPNDWRSHRHSDEDELDAEELDAQRHARDLRTRAITLAHENPALRTEILALLSEA